LPVEMRFGNGLILKELLDAQDALSPSLSTYLDIIGP